MTEDKIEFCIRLGKAMPLSCSVFLSLQKLGYLNCFKKIDIRDALGIDIYIVASPFVLKLDESVSKRFVPGDVFHVKDHLFRCFDESGEASDYVLTCKQT